MHTFHVQEFFIIIVQYMVCPTIGDFTLQLYPEIIILWITIMIMIIFLL